MEGLGKRFNRLWLSAGFSNLGDGVLLVGLGLVAARISDSATAVAGVLVAVQLPGALVTLHAGAVADRVDRRHLMLAVNAARAVTAAVATVVVLLGGLSMPLLYAVAVVLGTAEVFADTTTQSTVPMLVPPDLLSAANGRLVGVQMAGNNFVGPPLAGVLVGMAIPLALGVPGVLYGMAVGALLALGGSYRLERTASVTMAADIGDGLRFLLRHKLLRTLAAITSLVNISNNAFFAVFVLFVVGPDSHMGLPEAAYGALVAFVAAGALSASMVAQRIERRIGRVPMLVSAVTACGASCAIPIFTTATAPIASALFVAGFTVMLANVILASIRQRIVPLALLGRTNATMRLISVGAAPIGAALAGPIGDIWGLRTVFVAAALLCGAALPGFLVITEQRLAQAEAATDPATER